MKIRFAYLFLKSGKNCCVLKVSFRGAEIHFCFKLETHLHLLFLYNKTTSGEIKFKSFHKKSRCIKAIVSEVIPLHSNRSLSVHPVPTPLKTVFPCSLSQDFSFHTQRHHPLPLFLKADVAFSLLTLMLYFLCDHYKGTFMGDRRKWVKQYKTVCHVK